MVDSSPSTRGLMACLGEASRFRLVRALLDGARCVTDLAVEVGLSQSCTTRHLQVLERRHIVSGTRTGKRVMYRLHAEEPALSSLLAWALRPQREEGHREPRPVGTGGGSSRSGRSKAEPYAMPQEGGVDVRIHDARGRLGSQGGLDSGGVAPEAPMPQVHATPPASAGSSRDSEGPVAEAERTTSARTRGSDLEDYLL